MPRFLWPLQNGQPIISIYLRNVETDVLSPRVLLADTGAGDAFTAVELILIGVTQLALPLRTARVSKSARRYV